MSLIAGATLLLGLSACSPTKSPDAGSSPSATTTSPARPTASSPSSSSSPQANSSTNPSPATPTATKTGSPAPSSTRTPAKIEARVVLTPNCVRQGGQIRIDVSTLRGSGVIYQAFYADGKSGAEPPYGGGYGGNNGGKVDDSGHYRDSWTVLATAPVGPGRVEVTVGNAAGRSQTSTPFRVVPLNGSC